MAFAQERRADAANAKLAGLLEAGDLKGEARNARNPNSPALGDPKRPFLPDQPSPTLTREAPLKYGEVPMSTVELRRKSGG
jgi:hypothetical protein